MIRRITGLVLVLAIAVSGLMACKHMGPSKGTPALKHLYLVLSAHQYTINDQGEEDILETDVPLRVSFTLNGTVDGKPGVKAESGRTLPWQARVRTPRYEHIYVTRNARHYMVSISGTFAADASEIAKMPKTVFFCEIHDDGVEVRSRRAVVRGVTTTVECQWAR